jgi:hypothetical protein
VCLYVCIYIQTQIYKCRIASVTHFPLSATELPFSAAPAARTRAATAPRSCCVLVVRNILLVFLPNGVITPRRGSWVVAGGIWSRSRPRWSRWRFGVPPGGQVVDKYMAYTVIYYCIIYYKPVRVRIRPRCDAPTTSHDSLPLPTPMLDVGGMGGWPEGWVGGWVEREGKGGV